MTTRTQTATEFHRQHPVPLVMLLVALVLFLVALVTTFVGPEPLVDVFLWPALALVLVANVAIAIIRRRERVRP